MASNAIAPRRYLRLNDVRAYTLVFVLANDVWCIVQKWDPFAKGTIGKQFVRSVDSIAANIAEGFGRHMKREKIQFYRYSRGSIMESLNWTAMAHRRGLLNEEEYSRILAVLKALPREVNHLIAFTNQKLTI